MQMRGSFRLPAKLAESMRTDDALFVAYQNRLAPQRCLKVALKPVARGAGPKIANEADALFGNGGIAIHPDTVSDIVGCFVDHGVAFANLVCTPREDGSRVDVAVKFWPIEFVRWDSYQRCYLTQVEGGIEEPIVHGDGRWVIFQKHEHEPWKKEAALLAASLVWARHAFAIRDWAKGSVAHGNTKFVGELPEGVPLQKDNDLSPEAAAMLELLRKLASVDVPIGLRPAGSKTDLISNSSTAWQVWNELVGNGEKAAARIYLGTDGVLGSNGGAPGVDIEELFGVSSTLVEGDVRCLDRGFQTGVIEPWCAMNFGDSSLAPKRSYQLPDADEQALVASLAEREAAFFATIKAARENGFAITQAYVDTIARQHRLDPPPQLAGGSQQGA